MERSIAKSATILTVTKFTNLGIFLAITILLSRYRTLEEYGTYTQLVMVGNLTATFFMVALSGSINYFLANSEDKNQQNTFLTNFYVIATTLSLVSGVLLFLLSSTISKYFNNPLLSYYVFLLVFFPWINIIGNSIDNVLIAFNRIKLLAIYRITLSLCLLIVVTLTVLLELKFDVFLILFIVVQISFSIIVYIVVAVLIKKPKLHIDFKLIKKIFKFSFPLGIAYCIGHLHIEVDKIMVGRYYDTETFAIFSNATRELPITIVVASVTAVLLPQVIRLVNDNNLKKAIELWKSAVTLSFILLCFCTTLLVAFAPQIIKILYSEKYLSGINLFRISCLKIIIQTTNYAIILIAFNKNMFVLISAIISLVLNIILNYIFNLLFGIAGIAISTVLSLVVLALLQLYFSSIFAKVNITNLLPWKNIFKITLLNIGILSIIVYINKILFINMNEYFYMIVASILLAIIYYVIYKRRIVKLWKTLNTL